MITEQEIATLARLARLEFSEEEIKRFVPEFEEIIDFANKINEWVEGDRESLRDAVVRPVPLENLREDEVTESLPSDKVTSNVQSDNGYFSVRRVVK